MTKSILFNKALARALGKHLVHARIRRQLLQREIGVLVNVSRGYVADWELGRRLIDLNRWNAIRKHLDLAEYNAIRAAVERDIDPPNQAETETAGAVTQ